MQRLEDLSIPFGPGHDNHIREVFGRGPDYGWSADIDLLDDGIGILLGCLGLLAVRALYAEYKTVANLDWTMVATTIVLAVVSALLAGLYPTWRACRVQPAAQLKV